MVQELEDPVKWVYETYTLPCDPMWIGRTRYVDKAGEIWAAWEEIKKTDKWKQMYGNTDII